MKKRFVAYGSLVLGALAISFATLNVEAVSTDIVSKDEFVLNANSFENNNNNIFQNNQQLASSNNVSVKMGKNQGKVVNANNFEYGDYKFNYAIHALSSNATDPCYYVDAPKGTKIGMYYTLTSKEAKDNTYYVSDDSTLEVVKEVTKYRKVFMFNIPYTTLEVKKVYTEQSNSMYYSEFTFDEAGSVGLRAGNQYLFLFGVSVVNEEEITFRNQADLAIDALLSYYNENGLSTSSEFADLIANVEDGIKAVNHISQVDNYDEYLEILNLYNELVKVENSINGLLDVRANARGYQTVIKYDVESKALLDNVALDIENANNLGITNEMISNYDLYLAAVAKYNELEADYNNALNVVEKINNLDEVVYTEEYKNKLLEIESDLNNVLNIDLVSNYDEYLEKKNAFDQLSNDAINSFVSKVTAANEVKGTADSYALINEAYALYENMIESDKVNVEEYYNVLAEVANAYEAYENEVTENDFMFSYNEDGTVKSIFFIGTISSFVSASELRKITMSITNNETGEVTEVSIKDVYRNLKLSGVTVKFEENNVRYIYNKISNTDNIYANVSFTMTYTIVYKDGHVVTSNTNSIMVK